MLIYKYKIIYTELMFEIVVILVGPQRAYRYKLVNLRVWKCKPGLWHHRGPGGDGVGGGVSISQTFSGPSDASQTASAN